MSWDISLTCGCCGNPLKVEKHIEGGTYNVYGSDEALLNVTYNYGDVFYFKNLHKKSAEEVTDSMEAVVFSLGTERDEDYWKPTNGNVGYAVSILLKWAKMYPMGVFVVE